MVRAMTAAVLVSTSAVAACGGPATVKEQAKMTTTDDARAQALQAGIKLVAEKFPDFSPARKTPTLTDDGEKWMFTYELPADMLGGAPVVAMNKSDLSVVKTYRTQ